MVYIMGNNPPNSKQQVQDAIGLNQQEYDTIITYRETSPETTIPSHDTLAGFIFESSMFKFSRTSFSKSIRELQELVWAAVSGYDSSDQRTLLSAYPTVNRLWMADSADIADWWHECATWEVPSYIRKFKTQVSKKSLCVIGYPLVEDSVKRPVKYVLSQDKTLAME